MQTPITTFDWDRDRAPSFSPLSYQTDDLEDDIDVDKKAETPNTSSASSPSLPTPKSLVQDNAWRSDEARSFLQDLDNYIALGCLTSKSPAPSSRTSRCSSTWPETTAIPLDAFTLATLADGLRRLLVAGWIRVFTTDGAIQGDKWIFRIYILPYDAGHRFIDRQSKRLNMALEHLASEVDVSPDTWNGVPCQPSKFEMWSSQDPGSLFYMFNKIPSPSPSSANILALHSREALEGLLSPSLEVPGLKTTLYPYQRRSAAMMLQRETESRLDLDPRLEQRTAPDGSTFYFGARDLLFLRSPRLLEAPKGGILAETMGLGKTLICLSLILATRAWWPKIPAQYEETTVRPRVGSLTAMAITAINRHSIPWKAKFDAIEASTGEAMSHCVDLMRNHTPSYEIPVEPLRWNRTTTLPPPKKITLVSTTLVVVPRNLCSQWQTELGKHVHENVLSVLVMDDTKIELPAAEELSRYDVILFSRTRFEREIRDGSDDKGRRLARLPLLCSCPYIGASRTRDCTCLRQDDLYESPLKKLHFLRVIVDEGHSFSAAGSSAAQVANKLVTADHRWIVSGTPAKDLLGAEMDLHTSDATPLMTDIDQRLLTLHQRKDFDPKEDTTGAIKSIGSIASNFLKIRPWAAGQGVRPALWDEYIYRHESLRGRTYSGYSRCLRQTLQSIVVRTQAEDVERDIELPSLTHNIVRLEPSFYDKMTANIFTLVLTANAVTSQRSDQDYLFHKNSQKARQHLVHNLRQSSFFWCAFSEADVLAAIDHGTSYLDKEDISCSPADRNLLTRCMEEARTALKSSGWKALSKTHEIGIFVDGFPKDFASHWAFDASDQTLLTGATQLLDAQAHVHDKVQAGLADTASDGLAGAGIRALAPLRAPDKEVSKVEGDKAVLIKLGVPSSSVTGEPNKRKSSIAGKTGQAGKRRQSVLPYKMSKLDSEGASPRKMPQELDEGCLTVSMSGKPHDPSLADRPTVELANLALNSKFQHSRIGGTTSAKLSYLVTKVLQQYEEEKILIFYDGDNIAYYIAQALELLHIPHLIYAKTLTSAQKSNYIVRFDQGPHFRVLLMDVQQAAFGLNLSSASRVYFVNPVNRPHVEAQAIKRAHRIGQTKPVIVETLVLRGTIEEAMFERARRMTRTEHKDAKVLEDDFGIKDIIQSAGILPVRQEERTGRGQIAPLHEPQQLWCRPGWAAWTGVSRKVVENDEVKIKTPRKRKGRADVEAGGPDAGSPRKRARTSAPGNLGAAQRPGQMESNSHLSIQGTINRAQSTSHMLNDDISVAKLSQASIFGGGI